MNYAQSVTIGPRFFKKAFNDYANKFWAFARELMQNSIDCGSTKIVVNIGTFGTDHPKTLVVVENNGVSMEYDILVNKLLSLGESGKDFQAGSVGGFGKAKEILYFAHDAYQIDSGSWTVQGCGAGYNIESQSGYLHGTTSTVTWDGDHAEALRFAFKRFVIMSGLGDRVRFEIDGDKVRPRHAPGDVVRTLDSDGQPWAEVRLSKVEPNLLIVRVGGTPMFYDRCDYKGTVTLELLGTSADRLTSNRDGLKYPYSGVLRDFITTIAIDRHTAFVLEKAEYKRCAGTKLQRPGSILTLDPEAVAVGVAARVDTPEPTGGAGILVNVMSRVETPKAGILGHEFILKNCVRKPVPDQYDPDSLAFSDYSHWLVRAWAGCLLELYDLHEIDAPFSVGFIFSDKVAAESEGSREYGQVYYLNPCHVTKKGYTRRFKKFSRHTILADAAHEFIHGALNESYHGEDYANKLTEVMSTVMKHSRRFNRHLK